MSFRKLQSAMKFLPSKAVLCTCTSIYQPNFAYNTMTRSKVVLWIATWIRWIRYRDGYLGLLVFHSLFFRTLPSMLKYGHKSFTAWEVSVFGVILVHIFPHSEIYWEILLISPYSVRMRENADKNNSEYRHVLRSAFYQY